MCLFLTAPGPRLATACRNGGTVQTDRKLLLAAYTLSIQNEKASLKTALDETAVTQGWKV